MSTEDIYQWVGEGAKGQWMGDADGRGSSRNKTTSSRPPSAPRRVPVGRWTRTSIDYDIQRKRRIFMEDSWRLVIEGVLLKEGVVCSKFKAPKSCPMKCLIMSHIAQTREMIGDGTYISFNANRPLRK
jgi:hypothetical protein